MTSLSKEPANPYAPPQADVDQAHNENAAATPELAGRLTRLAAWLLDGLIATTLVLAPLLIDIDFQVFMRAARIDDDTGMLNALSASGMIGAALGATLWLGLTLYLVARNSQTAGKKLMAIKVVRSDGSHASMGRIFWLRNVFNVVPEFIPVLGSFYSLLDHLFIFGSSNQCLHDRIADTIVVEA
jgi:uncharacterized RDD family membrane protein YckC